MKLQTKTILFYLIVSLPILMVAACISYFSFSTTVSENLNEILLNKKTKAERQIDKFKEPQDLILSFDSLATIKIDTTNRVGHKFYSSFRMDPAEGEPVVYRTLRSYYHSNGTNYLIAITEPELEKDDLIENLLGTLLITITFIAFGFLVINWIISKTLWKPFYRILDQIKEYDVKSNSTISPATTSTKEFKQLNEAVLKMTQKMYSDFGSQKEFTENASHETQTPLAVIKARLDLLLQSPNLKQNEMEQLQIIENSVNKLASLNKALLLLTKIDNYQYKDTEEINVSLVLNKALHNFEDNIAAKNIRVSQDVKTDLKLTLNPLLAEILIGNLIQNAVRHNVSNGTINIGVTDTGFTISNSGNPLNMEADRMFERFKKNDDSKESLGLGLAIVKRIIESCNLKVNYEYREGLHVFKVSV